MDPIDIHFIPPSSSVLVALSSISPPSPILSAIGVSCSSEYIPILIDFLVEEAPSISYSASTATSLCTANQLESGVFHSGSVGTFGPPHPSPAFPDPAWPALDGPSSPTAASPNHASSNSLATPRILDLFMPTLPSSSPSPSVNSCPSAFSIRRKFKFPIDCNGPTLPTSKSWAPVLDSWEEIYVPCGAQRNTLAVPGCQPPQPHLQLSQDHVRPPLTPIPSHPQDPEIFLPKNLSWLKDIVVELLVDQEGFRAIHPTFKLVGFPKQTRGWDSSDGGLALFHPIKRETFCFHYAPLDGLPILRRLTINADESRDYISRQASLSLKANGVYTVQGSESSHLPPSCFESGDVKPASDHTKLKWKFDYLVDNRLEQSGRIIDGEKTLTPLTFLCSPWLLHPSQARKMKFMHIVKKSVTTKIVAEKLEPPMLPCKIAPTPHVKATGNHHLWTLHRRVHSSHTDEHSKPRKKSGSVRRAGENSGAKMGREENQEHAFVGRRRRASSAGEGRRPMQSECSPATLHPPATPFARHIVPRAQLAELLNTEPEEGGARRSLLAAFPGFHGLSPAPRRA